ncbi:hypothetical protein HPP92_002845 [Vanilla planifolia]|uniref:Uncharacterized protein n=1 Tax=Vanilla planifolia TaxID=51239 RepID=A0A835RU36_VANPL|nr:hypothetical protein HPP92_002845 [Vanilla planifolia]
MEPPSNQSYVGMNLSSRPEKQRLVGIKRPWPTQFPTSREKNFKSASISREEAGFLDGRILSLGLQNQRAEIRVSETGANLEHSTMYNFMGLPDEVMEEQRAALEGGRHVPVPTLLFPISFKSRWVMHSMNQISI